MRQKRAAQLHLPQMTLWIAAERLPQFRALWPDARLEPAIAVARAALPEGVADRAWESGRAMSAAQLIALAREAPGGPRGGKAANRAGGLSKRELDVARLVASGMTSRAIAERLFLSERTVESHLEHTMTKLGFSSRAQVAAWVTEHLRGPSGDA